MSNKGKFNQVILLHPNTYYVMLEDQLSTEFISRKLIPYLNDDSISDFNKWIKIKQELNIYMKRKNKPPQPALENNKSIINGDVNFNSENVNRIISKNSGNSIDKTKSDIFETPEKFDKSTPKLSRKQKNIKFYDELDFNDKSLNDSKKIKRKLEYEDYPKEIMKKTSLHENPNNDLKRKKSYGDDNSIKTSSKNTKEKNNGNESKTDSKHQYYTRSVQQGESWNKWISLY